ncbi:MAG: hypothetical protein ACYDA9_09445 [Terriglobia bacterium]
MTILIATSATSSGNPALFFVLCFVVGLILFIVGFRNYREYRILEDTPIAPVRSIPMGLVHLDGKATGETPLTSPLTGVPCYYYWVRIERYVKGDDDSGWKDVRNDIEERNFYLDDGTGRVLVNPHRAEYDVTQTLYFETGTQATRGRYVNPTLGVPGPTEQKLAAYLADNSKALAALESSNVATAKALGKVLAVGQSLGMGLSSGGVGSSFRNESYRFTEQCLLAERDCNIMGTCFEDPNPKDEHDRNLVMKGQNERTFLITSKSEDQVEESVRRKALLMINVGAALMVGTVAAALFLTGML